MNVRPRNCLLPHFYHQILAFFVVRNTNIQTVDTFLISGYSFMERDQNFRLIEKAKKITDRQIFVPQDWETIVAKASTKFIVVWENQDSITLEELKQFFKDSVTRCSG
jgi:hypothetical protein